MSGLTSYQDNSIMEKLYYPEYHILSVNSTAVLETVIRKEYKGVWYEYTLKIAYPNTTPEEAIINKFHKEAYLSITCLDISDTKVLLNSGQLLRCYDQTPEKERLITLRNTGQL